MARSEEPTDKQWAILAPLIPPTPRRSDGLDFRASPKFVLEGVYAWSPVTIRRCRLISGIGLQ